MGTEINITVQGGSVTVSADIQLPVNPRRKEVSVGTTHKHVSTELTPADGKRRFTVGEAAVRFVGRGLALAFSTWLRSQGLPVHPRSGAEWTTIADQFKNHPTK